MNYFITGTDTGAGKTYFTALMLRALRRSGVDAVGMKPICAGDRGDAETLHAASDEVESINLINPVWYRTPAAPYTAAMVEERPVDLQLIRESYRTLNERHAAVVVEGVGGWRVPILRDYDVSDLAREIDAQVIVVVRNRLGALNHALLTIDAVRQSGLPFGGYVLNCAEANDDPQEMVAGATNAGILADLLGRAPLAVLEPGQQTLPDGFRPALA